MLNAALAQVHAELAVQARLDDFMLFRRRVIGGEGYETIARTTGRTRQQCANAVRLVTDRLREALRSVLRDEGLGEAEAEQALADLYEAFGITRRE